MTTWSSRWRSIRDLLTTPSDRIVQLFNGPEIAAVAIEIKADSDIVRVTLSFDVAKWEFGDTIDDLLRRTDLVLYQAKAAGRNKSSPMTRRFLAEARV